jgi:diadenylate cyclase
MQQPFMSRSSCEISASLLEQVSQLRAALMEIERSLQEKHLRCCVFPELSGPEEITKTLFQLSIRRIGAFIAVEREMSLHDYAKTGILIDAEVSAALLLSLFYPGNPLHDGAVIIRKDRIIAGGCILPLSADHDTFKALGLGTRHRAGVGLSQVSDAVVFIVSEETGIISLAAGGKIFRDPLLKRADSLTRAVLNADPTLIKLDEHV